MRQTARKKATLCLCVTLTAIAMAMLASVTVSMGEETKGVFIVICLVSADVRSWVEDKQEQLVQS